MKFLNKLTVLCLLLGLSSCLGTKYLPEDRLLLSEQKIVGNEIVSTSELDDFYRQEPNLEFPLIPWAPYVSIYYLGRKFYDKDKIRQKRDEQVEELDNEIAEAVEEGRDNRAERLRKKKKEKIEKKNKVLEEGNLLMQIGEPIVIYDSALTVQTAEQMELYLESKGFFHGEVGFELEVKDENKAVVTYLIEENLPWTIDTLYLTVANNQIREILEEYQEDSYLDTTQLYDQYELSLERNRIDNLLKNHGYYEFSPQYVHFKVDTTIGEREVAIETIIYQPAERGYHKQFRIDSVIFTTDATLQGDLAGRESRLYNGIIYKFFEEKYSKRVLDNRVFMRPDSLYSRAATLETQKQLANLDIFKFVNVTYDTTGDTFDALIYTSPLKKFQTNNEIGVTYSHSTPGPYFNSTWTNRNTFGGLETLQLNLLAGIEGVPGTTDPTANLTSQQIGANLSLIFPHFLAPLGPRLRYRLGNLNPKSRLLVGYAYTNRPEFVRSTYNTSLTYSWQTEKEADESFYNNLYTFSPLDVSYINSSFQGDAGAEFLALLREWKAEGNPYIHSFDPAFVSSMYAYAIFNKNNYGTYIERSRYIRPFIESGGTSLNFIDLPFADENPAEGENGLRAYRFVKLSNDFRMYIPLQEKVGLAYRLNAGVAVPYGSENATLPYEKFFFAGGSNSVRSYRPRRLGPGVYNPALYSDEEFGEDEIITNQLEQPGEVLIEGSVEYRHNIFGFLNGAVFVDFGNIWHLDESAVFPGGEFQVDEFYKQMALGTGYGIRMDFSFLVVRFDLGVKIYNPMAVTPNGEGGYNYSEGWTFDKFKGFPFKAQEDLIILNIGIGYPF